MAKACKEILYNLCVDQHESCFQAFDPSDYTEIDKYLTNPSFQTDDAASLSSLADKALMLFTRASSKYETETQKRYSHTPAREQKKLDKKGDVAFPAFSMTGFQAFKRERSDFEEAVKFCCKQICDAGVDEERNGFNDAELLDSTLRDDEFQGVVSYSAKSGHVYERHHLLAVFSLWKIDRALLAIQDGKVADVARILVDAQEALTVSEGCYRIEVRELNRKKVWSEQQAKRGGQRNKNLDPYKEKVLKVYDGAKNWKSINNAATLIYKKLIDEYGETPLSEGECVKTISIWLTEHDPDRKKITGQPRLTGS